LRLAGKPRGVFDSGSDMSKTGNRILAGAKEALAIARGERQPAAVTVFCDGEPSEADIAAARAAWPGVEKLKVIGKPS
jgi:hypothetical protein